MRNRNVKPNNLDLSAMVYGKTPPQARDLEKKLLGMLILDPNQLLEVSSLLKPDDFYVKQHETIFDCLVRMNQKSQPIDLPLLVEKLGSEGNLLEIGGAFYITSLLDMVTETVNCMSYARIIKQYSLGRKLIIFSGDILNRAFEDDFFDTLDYANEQLFKLYEQIQFQTEVDLTAIGFKTAQLALTDKPDEDYIYTGIPQWDKINGSLFPSLYVVAARPGMGKTAFAVEIICRAAKKHKVGFINGEMTDEQIARRCISNLMEFNNSIFKKPAKEWFEEERKRFYAGLQEFVNLNLSIFSASMDLQTVCNKLRYWKRKLGIKFAILDYVQLLRISTESAKYMSTTDRLNECVDQLRMLAKEEELPIILLSQLNREVHKRAGTKRPGLADLKGSGAIEESAFQVSFLHRPEVYGEEVVDEFGHSSRGLMLQYIDKHRDGEVCIEGIKHRFYGPYSKVDPWEDEYSQAGWNPMNKDLNDGFWSFNPDKDSGHRLDNPLQNDEDPF